MKILAVDTSCTTAAVAVMEDGKLLGEMITNQKNTHSQKLMPMMDQLLDSLNITISDIDLFAAAAGPGSFTGLRIGIVSIKALAYALGKPAVSIPTLDAMAHQIPETPYLICPIMDARNNQVYTALYQYDHQKLLKISEYQGISVEELVTQIHDHKQKTIFSGDGVLLHQEYLKQSLQNECAFAEPAIFINRASTVAKLAYQKHLDHTIENAMNMVPFYLRKSQAERLKAQE